MNTTLLNFTWFGVTWASLYNLRVLPLIIIIIGCYLYRQSKINSVIEHLAGRWRSLVIRNFSPYKQYLRVTLFVVGLLCLFFALLRPQWHRRQETIAQEGRDLFIALDISRSMLATDCYPNRLALAKKKIKQLLQMLDCERVGLILFSGSGFVQCPLTTDYAAFHMFLDHVDVETISSGTTALDAALQQSLEAFNAGAQRKNKLLVVFTDGEDFSRNLMQTKQEAKKANMSIFTLGVGTVEGAPIPIYNETGKQVGHQKDSKGNVVISQLNDGILYTLANDVGGMYLPITKDSSDLKKLVARIHDFEKEHFEDKQVARLDDKYHYFLLASLFCFLLEWLL